MLSRRLCLPLLIVFLTPILTGCGALNRRTGHDTDVQRAAAMLTGCFDSLDQAATDPENYFKIRLILTKSGAATCHKTCNITQGHM